MWQLTMYCRVLKLCIDLSSATLSMYSKIIFYSLFDNYTLVKSVTPNIKSVNQILSVQLGCAVLQCSVVLNYC